jgi:integrase
MFPDTEQIKKVVAEMLEDLSLRRPGRGPHTFRHYVATKLFYEGNMRIEDISVLLGTTVEIIVKNYLHPTPDMLKRRVFKAMQWDDPWDEI